MTRSQTSIELVDAAVEEFPATTRQRQQRLTSSSRNESRSVRGDVQHSVTSIAFAHDGQVLVSAGAADGLVKLWDVRQLSRGSPLWEIADEDPPERAGGKNWFRGDGESAGRRPRGSGAVAGSWRSPWRPGARRASPRRIRTLTSRCSTCTVRHRVPGATSGVTKGRASTTSSHSARRVRT